MIADTLVAMYNPQLATWRTSPAANEIERHTLAWLAAKFGLPRHDQRELHERRRGGESLGGDRRVDARVPGVRRGRAARALPASPTIYLTREAHDSFNKIAHMTGIGRGRCARSRPTAI